MNNNSGFHFNTRTHHGTIEERGTYGDMSSKSRMHATPKEQGYMAQGGSSYLRIESEKSSFHTRLNESSMMQQAAGARPRQSAAHQGGKTSSYMQRYNQNKNVNQFWADLTRIATH